MPARLVKPSVEWLEPFMRLVDEVQGERDFANVAAVRQDGWEPYFARVEGMRAGTLATRSGVPMSTFWLLDDADEIIGVSGLQHRLTPSLRQFGGHIGYAVRPSARGRGFGTALLAATLAEAREMGIDEVVVTCDADNIPSRRVIERCGGVLEAEERVPQWPVLVRRYLIARNPP